VLLQTKQHTEQDLPSLSFLVRHIAVLFAIVTVTTVHGQPVAVHPVI